MPIDLIIEIFTFALVVGATLVAVRTASGVLSIRRRLNIEPVAAAPQATGSVLRSDAPRNPFMRWVQSSTSISDPKDRQKLRQDLFLAGFESDAAPVWYVIIRFSLAIGLPLGFILLQALRGHPVANLMDFIIVFGLCGFGLIAPRGYVDRRARSRAEQMEREFPDVLDLTVVCVEAGLGLEAAFIRVGEEVRESHPLMSRAFERVSEEMRAGRSRADALRNMADTVNVNTVRSFVALLIQTDSLGTSIAQTLRSYAIEMREHRFLAAEEKAMRIPVLMTIPLITCILPVIIAALLLPPILDVVRTIGPAMTRRGSPPPAAAPPPSRPAR